MKDKLNFFKLSCSRKSLKNRYGYDFMKDLSQIKNHNLRKDAIRTKHMLYVINRDLKALKDLMDNSPTIPTDIKLQCDRYHFTLYKMLLDKKLENVLRSAEDYDKFYSYEIIPDAFASYEAKAKRIKYETCKLALEITEATASIKKFIDANKANIGEPTFSWVEKLTIILKEIANNLFKLSNLSQPVSIAPSSDDNNSYSTPSLRP